MNYVWAVLAIVVIAMVVGSLYMAALAYLGTVEDDETHGDSFDDELF